MGALPRDCVLGLACRMAGTAARMGHAGMAQQQHALVWTHAPLPPHLLELKLGGTLCAGP